MAQSKANDEFKAKLAADLKPLNLAVTVAGRHVASASLADSKARAQAAADKAAAEAARAAKQAKSEGEEKSDG